jgi:hypothetical protein
MKRLWNQERFCEKVRSGGDDEEGGTAVPIIAEN